MYYSIPQGETKAGIAIGFDDSERADTWIAYHTNYGAAKNWKATFNVYETAVAQQLTDIGALVTAGHALANHGLTADGTIKKYDPYKTNAQFVTDILEYIDDWMFAQFGVRSTCFVYPYGDWDQFYNEYAIANSTYKGFRRIGAIINYEQANAIFSQSRSNNGNMMAGSVDNLDDSEYTSIILPALQYAKNNNKIVMLYGHDILETEGAQAVKRTVLDSICDFVNTNDMKFYTYNELANSL